MKLIHSYHYLKNGKYIIENNFIKNSKGDIILGLVNIPECNNVYQVKLEKILLKKKSLMNYRKFFGYRNIDCENIYSNFSVVVYINIELLINTFIKTNSIPSRVELFKLLSRNFNEDKYNSMSFIQDYPSIIQLNINSVYKINKIEKISKYILKKNYKRKCCYFDLLHRTIYLDYSNIPKRELNYKNKLVYIRTIKEIDSKLKLKEFNLCSKKKRLIICDVSNVKKWEYYLKSNYLTIRKFNDSTLTYNDLESYSFIILPIQLLSSYDYETHFKNYINIYNYKNENTFSEYTKALNIIRYEQTLNDNYKNKTDIIFQILDYSIIIFDNLYKNIPYHMIRLFNSEYKFFISKNYYKDKIRDIISIFSNFLDLTLEETEDTSIIFSNIYRYYETESSIKERIVLLNYNEYDKKALSNIENISLYREADSKINLKDLYESICLNYSKVKYKYIKDLDEKIDYNKICPICLNDLVINNNYANVAITVCSHLFCYDCIINNRYVSNKCPKCRKELIFSDIYKATNKLFELDKFNMINDMTRHRNRNNFLGSKLIYLLQEYLNSFNTFNCVIISNYLETIQNLQQFMESLGIKCKTVTSKRKQIEIHAGINIIHFDTITNIKYLDKSINKFFLLDNPKEINYYKNELNEYIKSVSSENLDIINIINCESSNENESYKAELISFEFNPLTSSSRM